MLKLIIDTILIALTVAVILIFAIKIPAELANDDASRIVAAP